MLAGHLDGEPVDRLEAVLSVADLTLLQQRTRQVRVDDSLCDYLLDLIAATRVHADLYLGGSTRAALGLHRAAQALALVEGRDYVVPDDLKRLAGPVLAHRLLPRRARSAGGADPSEEVLEDILARTPVPA